MKYLLDTNILSELRKPKPDKKVVSFISAIARPNIFISCISIGEIQKGISSCNDIKLKADLEDWLKNYLVGEFDNQILNIDNQIMLIWGNLMARVKNLPIIDSIIAATCLAMNLTLVTRNIKDFERVEELTVINPFI